MHCWFTRLDQLVYHVVLSLQFFHPTTRKVLFHGGARTVLRETGVPEEIHNRGKKMKGIRNFKNKYSSSLLQNNRFQSMRKID